jgi:hypothetical protein
MSISLSHDPSPLFTCCSDSWASLPLTSEDIKASLDDLKVLGKGDFKALLKWRTALREEVSLGTLSLFNLIACFF